jgi:diaminopimelate decarboxylase
MPQKKLEIQSGRLFIDKVSAEELTDKFATPLYVLSETRIRENYRRLHEALIRNYKRVRIHYAAKANTNLSVLKIVESEGAYIDSVSTGEVFLSLEAGFPSEKILFTGTCVTNEELSFLVKSNVIINIDSISQLCRLLKMARPEILSVRINPEVGAGHHIHNITAGKDSKFGLWRDEVAKAYEKAKKNGVKKFGIHMHIGSGILRVEPFVLATKKLLEVAKEVHKKVGLDFEFIDIGGGIGVPYKPEDEELDLKEFSNRILNLFREKIEEYDLGEPIFCVEPGRYIVCDAGYLLTKVNTIKKTPFKKYVGVDAGFNTLLRPTMYGSYHSVVVANRLSSPEDEIYDLAGPICESGDLLARNRKLPKIQEGDLIALFNAGAYGYSMSSQYNSRPRAAEVLVKDGEYSLIREREDFNSLLHGQTVPKWLK